jgi:putative protein-disulfide isomerase
MRRTLTRHPATLYYIHDPMCSWCWGFVPVWQQVKQQLSGRVTIEYLLGGLAPDTDLPMPQAMQVSIRDTWRRIQQEIPGIEFNYEFWTLCQPRRSTYPACRAVIASGMQDSGQQAESLKREKQEQMLRGIQEAYYLKAMNPSDDEVLIAIAQSIGLDADQFSVDLNSDECKRRFKQQRQQRREMGVRSFPNLVLSTGDRMLTVPIDYRDADSMVQAVLSVTESSG